MVGATGQEIEKRSYWRSADVPGFEFMEATSSKGPWQIYNVRYAISIPVAHDLGFSDQSHFTRHIKRLLGQPPGSYARGADMTPFALRRLGTSQSDGITYAR